MYIQSWGQCRRWRSTTLIPTPSLNVRRTRRRTSPPALFVRWLWRSCSWSCLCWSWYFFCFIFYFFFIYAVRAVFQMLIALLFLAVVQLKKVGTKFLKSQHLGIFTKESNCIQTLENWVLAGVFGWGCAKEPLHEFLYYLHTHTHTHTQSHCHVCICIAAAGILVLPRRT